MKDLNYSDYACPSTCELTDSMTIEEMYEELTTESNEPCAYCSGTDPVCMICGN